MWGEGERVVCATWKGGVERARGWSNEGARSIEGREVGGCMCTAVAMVLGVSAGCEGSDRVMQLTAVGLRASGGDIRSSGSVLP